MLAPKGLVFADALTVRLHQEAPSPPTARPDPRARIQLLQPSCVVHGGGRASVYMQCPEQQVRSPCHVRKGRKLWEDLTRCNVTCQDPTWTFFLSINSSFGSSQKSRQVPEEALCGWPEGGYLLSSSDLYFPLVFLGGKKCWRCPTSSTCH